MLKQTGSVSKFTTEFKIIANIPSINDESHFTLFNARLKTEVAPALVLICDVNSFEDSVDTAVQIDHVNFTLTKVDAKVEFKPSANKSNS